MQMSDDNRKDRWPLYQQNHYPVCRMGLLTYRMERRARLLEVGVLLLNFHIEMLDRCIAMVEEATRHGHIVVAQPVY